MLPQHKVAIEWSAEFAYAIGLLVTEGNLSKDGRHISFTSKDIELIHNLRTGLQISGHIGKKSRSSEKEKKYFVVQFSDVIFYRFLLDIGLTSAKSKTLGEIGVPDQYFLDFLRGHLDGDGSFYSYFDPRWKSSYMFYTTFLSASQKHVDWLRQKIRFFIGIAGHITKSQSKNSVFQLKYAKSESLKLLPLVYYNENVLCLTRKREKVIKGLQVENFSL